MPSRGTKQGHSPAKMLDFPELPLLWNYERSFCSTSICIPQHIYKEINQDTSTKVNRGKRPAVLRALYRKASGLPLCLDTSGKSKSVMTYACPKRDPLSQPVQQRGQKFAGTRPYKLSETQPPRGKRQEQSSHKEPRGSSRRGERAGKTSATKRREQRRPSLIIPSPRGIRHKRDGEAKQIRRSQTNASLAVQINRRARLCWRNKSVVCWRAEGGTQLGAAPGGEGGDSSWQGRGKWLTQQLPAL